MSAVIRAVPVPGHSTRIETHGRTFAPTAVDLPAADQAVVVLGANGWSVLPPRGGTADRPRTAAPGTAFIDTDLGKVVFALCWPTGSGNVVGWCDMNGTTA